MPSILLNPSAPHPLLQANTHTDTHSQGRVSNIFRAIKVGQFCYFSFALSCLVKVAIFHRLALTTTRSLPNSRLWQTVSVITPSLFFCLFCFFSTGCAQWLCCQPFSFFFFSGTGSIVETKLVSGQHTGLITAGIVAYSRGFTAQFIHHSIPLLEFNFIYPSQLNYPHIFIRDYSWPNINSIVPVNIS